MSKRSQADQLGGKSRKKGARFKILGSRGMHSLRCQAALRLMLFTCTVPSDKHLMLVLLGRNMFKQVARCFMVELRLWYCMTIRLLLHKVISYYCIRQNISGLALLNTSVCMCEHKAIRWLAFADTAHALQGKHNGCINTGQMQVCKH